MDFSEFINEYVIDVFGSSKFFNIDVLRDEMSANLKKRIEYFKSCISEFRFGIKEFVEEYKDEDISIVWNREFDDIPHNHFDIFILMQQTSILTLCPLLTGKHLDQDWDYTTELNLKYNFKLLKMIEV